VADIAEYVGIEFKSKNLESKTYQGMITSVFFVINIVNLLIFIYALINTKWSEIGQVQILILVSHLIMLAFNFPYKLYF